MKHTFVSELERELAVRKETYSKLVREKRMPPEVARRQYNALEALLKFVAAYDRKSTAEARYQPVGDAFNPDTMKTLEDMAEGDKEARRIWNEWAPIEEKAA